MAELGVAASIVGFASLVIELTKLSVEFVSKVSSASKTQAAYIEELTALNSVLEEFKNAAAVDGLELIVGHREPSISTPAMESYKRQIERVKVKLEKSLNRTGPFSGLMALKWPFEESEMTRVLEMLHRFRGILESSLLADDL
jgi:hypothetical protein